MLTIRRASHATQHNGPEKEKSQRQRSSYENAVLKAYGIVPVHEYSSSSQEETVTDLKPSQVRWKASDSSVTWKNETPSHKSRGNGTINDKQAKNPFETGQARTAAQAKKKEYENDVLKAYGLFSPLDMFL